MARRESQFVKNILERKFKNSGKSFEPGNKKTRAVRLAGGARTKLTYTAVARYFLAEEDRHAKKTRAERMLDEIYEIVTNKDNPPAARVQAAEWLRKVAFGDIPKPPQVVQIVETLQQALPQSQIDQLIDIILAEGEEVGSFIEIENDGQDNIETASNITRSQPEGGSFDEKSG